MREMWAKYKSFMPWGILGIVIMISLVFFVITISIPEQRVNILKQKDYVSGGSGFVTVKIVSIPYYQRNGSFFINDSDMNGNGGEPLIGKVKVELLDINKKTIKVLSDWSKNEKDTQDVNLEIPAGISGEHYLKVYAKSLKGTDKIFEKINITNRSSEKKLTLHTDKSLYRPGDEVSFRALLTRKSDDIPLKSDVKILINDGNKNVVYNENITSSENGIVGGKFRLANKVNSGSYSLKAEVDNSTSELLFEVKPYVLPKFKIEMKTDKKDYLVNEDVTINITGTYFFGEPVKGGKGNVKLGEATKEVSLDDKGRGSVVFKAVNEGKYEFLATITDPSNYQASQSTLCYAQKDPVQISFMPENNKLLKGVENTVYVFSKKIDGSPLKSYLTISGPVRKELATDINGMAQFQFTPMEKSVTFDVTVTDENSTFKFIKKFDFPVLDEKSGMIIRTDKLIYNQEEKVETTIVRGAQGTNIRLFAVKDGKIIKVVSTLDNKIQWDFPKETSGLIEFYGQNTNNTFDNNMTPQYMGEVEQGAANNSISNEFSKKCVLIKPNKKLLIDIGIENKTYKPGEEVNLTLNMKDKNNRGLNGAVGLSILDEAVLNLRDNDFSLDNLKLALADIKAQEGINGEALYNAILNDMPPATIAPMLVSTSNKFDLLNKSNNDNSEKVQDYKEKALIAFIISIILFIIISLIRFIIARMIAFYIVGAVIIFVFMYLVISIIEELFFSWPYGYNQNSSAFFLFFLFGVATLLIVFVNSTYDIFTGRLNAENDINIDKVKKGYNGTKIFLVVMSIILCLMFTVIIFRQTMISKFKPITRKLGGAADGEVPSTSSNRETGSAGGGKQDVVQAATKLPSIFDFGGKYFGGTADGGEDNNSGVKKIEKTRDEKVSDSEKKENVINQASAITKLRNVFMESLMFIPELIIKDGKGQLKIPLADNITTWKVRLIGNSQDGYVGSNNSSIKVFQDFFVNFELPKNLMVDDTISIPLTVFNYLPQNQDVALTVANQPWFTLADGQQSRSIAVEGNSQKLIYLPIKIIKAGKFKFRVDAKGFQGSDAIEKDIKINPAGFQIESISAYGRLAEENKEKVIFLDKDIEGTRKIKLKLFPSPITRAIDGLESLLNQPHGCFEQISSSLYPDILVLKNLKTQKNSNPAFESKAKDFIRTGFQQILTYETRGESGGFSLYGDSPAETVLTAYGLMEFSELKEVYPVDDNLINRMKNFLKSKQQGDGSFEITGHHAGGASNTSTNALNSYIGWALSGVLKEDADFAKTVAYLKDIAKSEKDSYTLSLIANILANRNDSEVKSLLKTLVERVVVEGDKAYVKSNIIDYYGTSGVNQDLQATALLSMALSKSGIYQDINQKLINFIIAKKQAYGGFGTTQATILALKAIIESSKVSEIKDGKIIINVNGKEETIEIKKENALNLYQREFETNLKENDVSLKASNEQFSYEFVKEYYVGFGEAKSSNSFEVKRELDTKHFINKDSTEKIKIINSQSTEVKNMMAVINIPQGCSLDYGALDAQKKAKVFEDYNLSEDVLEVYFRNIAPSEMKNLEIKMKPGYPMEVFAGGIRVYDYYNPERETRVAPMRIVVDK